MYRYNIKRQCQQNIRKKKPERSTTAMLPLRNKDHPTEVSCPRIQHLDMETNEINPNN